MGREVTRAHGEARAEALSEGLVVAWLPATASDPFLDGDGQPAPLFKVLFRGGGLAGEEEDLEESEVEECLSDLPDGDVSDDPGWRSRPWCRVLAKPGPLAKFEPGADRGGLAERRLAEHLDASNVAHLLAFAHDRGCAGLKRSCLEFLQRSYNPLFQDAGGDSVPLPLPRGDAAALEDALPGYGAAAATPSLARELRRALDGI